MKIRIETVKNWREQIGATHLVVFAMGDDEAQHVATHGRTRTQAKEAADAGNRLKTALGWPPDKCRDKPLARLCENCVYYKPNHGVFCANGWSGDGSRGFCLLEPQRVAAVADGTCRHFEPAA